MITLSIIIVSYNTKDAIENCIDSIISNCGINDYEIIVVDNNSKDSSLKLLRGFWRKHKNITLLENNENLGFSKAVNQGIDKSRGKNILLLNSDTKLLKGSIKYALNFIGKRNDAGVIGFRLLNEDLSIQPSCYNFPSITNAIKEYIFGVKGAYDKFYPKGNSPVSVDVVVGAAFLITQETKKQVGKFDEKYFMYMEDIDYCKRVHNEGFEVYYLPKSKVVHIHGESGKYQSKIQLKRLVQSSKLYHGVIKYFLVNFVIWIGQKLRR